MVAFPNFAQISTVIIRNNCMQSPPDDDERVYIIIRQRVKLIETPFRHCRDDNRELLRFLQSFLSTNW